jgi:hypothetical protein
VAVQQSLLSPLITISENWLGLGAGVSCLATVSVHPMHVFSQCTPNISRVKTPYSSTRYSSTNIDPLQAALDKIKLREPGAKFCYTEIAARHSVN